MLFQSTEPILEDYLYIKSYQEDLIDILIVVHNQVQYTKACIDSIVEHTDNYNLYIWDNASTDGTKEYLETIAKDNIFIHWNEKNDFFIKPNNELVQLGDAPYIVLLNNDTIVKPDWDKFLVSKLQNEMNCGAVGYLGGLVNSKGQGIACWYGKGIDFVQGWCLAFRRETYNKFGLFDNNFSYAYCEDSDFSFRLRQHGYDIYAGHLGLVQHLQQSSTSSLKQQELAESFSKNHAFLAIKWSDFLDTNRAILSYNRQEIIEIAQQSRVSETALLFEAGKL